MAVLKYTGSMEHSASTRIGAEQLAVLDWIVLDNAHSSPCYFRDDRICNVSLRPPIQMIPPLPVAGEYEKFTRLLATVRATCSELTTVQNVANFTYYCTQSLSCCCHNHCFAGDTYDQIRVEFID